MIVEDSRRRLVLCILCSDIWCGKQRINLTYSTPSSLFSVLCTILIVLIKKRPATEGTNLMANIT